MPASNLRQEIATPAWASEDGPSADVVLSTRARFARNIREYPFPGRAAEADLRRVERQVEASAREFGGLAVIRPHTMSEDHRLALVNSRLASSQLVDGGVYRSLIVDETGMLGVMVNEEDHLRIQYILPGLQPTAALDAAQEYDNFTGSRVCYARSAGYGYLTSSLANIGTGLRISVMLHLPALVFSEEAVAALTAAAELKISVRGLFGEGSKAFGDIFQVSNETTIGFSEREITARVRAAAEHLIAREREARRKLASESKTELTEILKQVLTILADTSRLSSRDAMAYLSMLRLGAEMGLCSSFPAKSFKELLVAIQVDAPPSGGCDTGTQSSLMSDTRRAGLVRARLKALYSRHDPNLRIR